jgi:hypothetical protein
MEPWLVGMQLALLGSFCSAVGLVLLKHSTNVEGGLPCQRKKFWWIGFLFLIVNASVIDVFAFSLAPITLIAPFTGVTIVFTSWLASSGMLFVKETLDVWDATSTGITLAGVTITSMYGPHESVAPDMTNTWKYFSQPDFVTCVGALIIVLVFGWALVGVDAVSLIKGSRDVKTVSARAQTGRILLYAFSAAFAGSMSMLLLKVIGTGIKNSLESNFAVPLVTPGWLLCLCGLITCAVVQLMFLHRTLANSPVSYGVPTYQTLLTLLTILLGGIFFSEFRKQGWFTMTIFGTGVGLALFGVALHTTHRSQADAPLAGAPSGAPGGCGGDGIGGPAYGSCAGCGVNPGGMAAAGGLHSAEEGVASTPQGAATPDSTVSLSPGADGGLARRPSETTRLLP